MIWFEPAARSVVESEARASVDGSETGGILLGHDATGPRSVQVTVAGGPGPAAQRNPLGFLRDLRHALELADDAYMRDGSVWVGEWHTHPVGQQHPSSQDMRTYRLLLEDPELGFSELVSVIVTPADGWTCTELSGWVIRPSTGRSGRLVAAAANILPSRLIAPGSDP